MSGFRGLILFEDGTVDTNPPSESGFLQRNSSPTLSDRRYFCYPNTWELGPFKATGLKVFLLFSAFQPDPQPLQQDGSLQGVAGTLKREAGWAVPLC